MEKMAVKIFTTLVIPFSRRGNDGAKFLIERIVFSWVDRGFYLKKEKTENITERLAGNGKRRIFARYF